MPRTLRLLLNHPPTSAPSGEVVTVSGDPRSPPKVPVARLVALRQPIIRPHQPDTRVKAQRLAGDDVHAHPAGSVIEKTVMRRAVRSRR